MADIVITEFMDEAAVVGLAAHRPTLYDPDLVDRPADLVAAVADCRALIVRNRTQVRDGLLAAAARLVVVGRLGVGLDNIDLAACRSRGIAVCPASGANDLAVAEYAVAAVMVLLRGAFFSTQAVAMGGWPRDALIAGRETSGRQLGLIGFGAIARQTAVRAIALGMRVAAFDPYVAADDPAWAASGVEPMALDALLSSSDAVSLHVPLTPATRGLIGADALACMKRGAVLVNAARGGIVDHDALAAALKAGRLGGAALDVFDNEPLSQTAGAVFSGCPNLILTPHIAGVSEESNRRVSALTAANVMRELTKAGLA